jgi:hypothetical protein
MKRYLLLLAFALTACGSGPTYPYGTPTPTPNPGEIALQMVQQQMAAEATQQVVGLQFTATAQVFGQTATVQAFMTQAAITHQARMDAEATSAQERRDAQATQQRIDAESTQAQARIDAQSTADQARLDLQATQTAEQIAREFSMTQAVMPTHNLWTQQAIEQDILLATNQVELSNLEVEQQRQTNTLDWAVPMGIAILLTAALLVYVWSHTRVREIKNGDGDIELVIFDNKQAFKPQLMPKPVLMLETGDMPDMTSAQEQSDIVRREQGVRALAVMPVNPTAQGAQAFNAYFGQVEKREQPYEIVDGASIPAELMDAQAMKAIENDWKEGNNG